MRDDLMALEGLSDDALWQLGQSRLSEENSQRQGELLEKYSSGTITEHERQTLADLRNEADQLMLRKAYALVLMKWRGHRLPPLATSEADE